MFLLCHFCYSDSVKSSDSEFSEFILIFLFFYISIILMAYLSIELDYLQYKL